MNNQIRYEENFLYRIAECTIRLEKAQENADVFGPSIALYSYSSVNIGKHHETLIER